MQKVFDLTNKYIILATPLILFSLITTLYIAGTANGKVITVLIALVLFTLMTGAFIAGWFNMIKQAVLDPEREDANSLIKDFPEGVGEYFIPSLGAVLTIFIFTSIIVTVSYLLGIHFIGDPGITAESLSKTIGNTEALKALLASLSQEQLLKINLWNFLLMGTMMVSYLLLMLYMPAMFFKSKNPFMAFFISLKDLFSKKFFLSLGIYFLIFSINALISLFSALFSGMMILYFLFTLINFYFLTIAAVGIFYYYYHNFVKPKNSINIDAKV